MLSAYRVLDLADQRGMFCGYVLAQLGAEVIAVEPPGGSPARFAAPFAQGAKPGADGLWWHAYARGKASCQLDLSHPAERQRLHDLAAEADFLIESFTAQEAQARGVDYETLAAINPALIVVSVSPFGRTGPKADWPATDLTVWASCGAHALAGDDDRAPVRTSVPQTFLHAGADAAGAALIALQARHRDGRGQHVDVSAQQCSAQAALSAHLGAPNNAGMVVKRIAGGLAATFPVQLTWPCKDGYVALALMFGHAFTAGNRRLLGWLREHDACSAEDAEKDWGLEIAEMVQGGQSPEPYFELCRKIEAFTRQRTQQALFREGIERGIYIAPAFDIAELLAEPHFQARGFWTPLDIGAGSPVAAPGPFARLSASPLLVPGPAPALAQGGVDALPAKPSRASARRMAAPTAKAPPSADARPLAGLKVLDFMWVIAGPFFTRVLADYGATVVKVESGGARMEPARAAPPFKDGAAGVETGLPFANFNAGKLGVTIDPGNPAGREVILDLVRWADVVTESFSPKAMKGWGLDYAALSEVNPSIIMLSSCLMGHTGPRSSVPGFGNMAAALTGFYELTGWPDRSPAGPYLAYTDGVSPRFMLAALLGALEHRRSTGEGQHIDVSQAESAIHMLGPAILQYGSSGQVWTRMGNRDLELCPHGVYPARGDDRWVAIACQSDAAWRSLCTVMGLGSARADPAFADAAGRRASEEALNVMISAWTSEREEGEIEAALIAAGVAAHVVQNTHECWADPQLRHREHFAAVPHASMGEVVVESTRCKLSRTPGGPRRAGPILGEHNAQVLQDILGYDDERIANVFASMAME